VYASRVEENWNEENISKMIRIVYIAVLVALFSCVSYGVEDTKHKQAVEQTIKVMEKYSASGKKYEELSEGFVSSTLKSITELENQADIDRFMKDFFDALFVIINNSVDYYKNKKIDYISDYCMTSDFQNTIKDLLKLKKTNQYKMFTNDSELMENFDVIGHIIDEAVKTHMDGAYSDWSITFAKNCDLVETPRYVNCSKKFDKYIQIVISMTDGMFINNYDVMTKVEKDMVAMSNLLLEVIKDCKCLEVPLKILEENFSSTQSVLIKEINTFIKEHCTNACPYIWNITYTHDYLSKECPDSPTRLVVTASFENVMIYPRGDFILTNEEEEACSSYFTNDTGRPAKNVRATSYEASADGVREEIQSIPVFKYDGLRYDGLTGGRDKLYDIPFKKLSNKYKKGRNGVEVYKASHDYWPGWAATSEWFFVFEDIFEEIYLYKSFTVGDNKGKFTFTPVSRR